MVYFLILYLWQGGGIYNTSTGGPVLVVTPVPSLAACEQLGAATKQFADEQSGGARAADPRCRGSFGTDTGACATRPAAYRCVAVRS